MNKTTAAKIISLLTHPLWILLFTIFFFKGIETRVRLIAFGELILLPGFIYLFCSRIEKSGTFFSPGRTGRLITIIGFILGLVLFYLGDYFTNGNSEIYRIPDYILGFTIFFFIFFGITLLFFENSIHMGGFGGISAFSIIHQNYLLLVVAIMLLLPVYYSRYHLKAHSHFELIFGFFSGIILYSVSFGLPSDIV